MANEIDLTTLSPAPWAARGEGVCCGLYAEPSHRLIFDPDATWTDTQFCALARNALDVMMRRGWYAEPDSEKWFVRGECTGPLSMMGDCVWSDPFTALVEADRWYAEHVEQKVVARGE